MTEDVSPAKYPTEQETRETRVADKTQNTSASRRSGVGTTILCLARDFRGAEFLCQVRQEGCRTIVLTRERFADREWPWEAIDRQVGAVRAGIE